MADSETLFPAVLEKGSGARQEAQEHEAATSIQAVRLRDGEGQRRSCVKHASVHAVIREIWLKQAFSHCCAFIVHGK